MYTNERIIEIDAGHRIHTHGSKCANIHGHRYKIVAQCVANTMAITGEQTAMVIDFDFLKKAMLRIDEYCDHAMILDVKDPWLGLFITDTRIKAEIDESIENVGYYGFSSFHTNQDIKRACAMGKIFVMQGVPTAENLAELWFEMIYGEVKTKSNFVAELKQLTVWETPNCMATYFPAPTLPEQPALIPVGREKDV